MRTFVVFLVVLVGAAIGGDRVAAHLAASEAEDRLAAHGLADPQVEVGGFPFLTQLASREFSEVQVRAASLDVAQGSARDVDLTAREVDAPSGGDVVLGRVDGEGLIAYDEVLRRAGTPPDLRLRAGRTADTVRVTSAVEVLGERVDVEATARVRASGDTVRVTPQSFRLPGGGTVRGQLSAVLADRLTVVYRIRDLPDGLRIRDARSAPAGFVVRVAGDDVRVGTLG